jgi:hypothetical protein
MAKFEEDTARISQIKLVERIIWTFPISLPWGQAGQEFGKRRCSGMSSQPTAQECKTDLSKSFAMARCISTKGKKLLHDMGSHLCRLFSILAETPKSQEITVYHCAGWKEFSAHLKPTSSMFAYLHVKSVHASLMAWGTVKWYILLHPGFSCWSSDLFACPIFRTAIIIDAKVITTIILEWIRCQNMVFCDIQQRYSKINKLILQWRCSTQKQWWHKNSSTK